VAIVLPRQAEYKPHHPPPQRFVFAVNQNLGAEALPRTRDRRSRLCRVPSGLHLKMAQGIPLSEPKIRSDRSAAGFHGTFADSGFRVASFRVFHDRFMK
jgi:hypothetical protein